MTESQYIRERNNELVRKNRALREENGYLKRAVAAMIIVAGLLQGVTIKSLTKAEQRVDKLSAEIKTVEARIVKEANAEFYASYKKLANQLDEANERANKLAEELDDLSNVNGCYKLENCKITAYCCEPYPHICGEGHGITKSGMPVQPGVVAVDTSVIPLGSIVIIGGVAYVAADTGGAIEGKHIDIAVETHDEALEFGIQTQDVWVVTNGK